eukprot:2274099-Rhodomonas_salina.2
MALSYQMGPSCRTTGTSRPRGRGATARMPCSRRSPSDPRYELAPYAESGRLTSHGAGTATFVLKEFALVLSGVGLVLNWAALGPGQDGEDQGVAGRRRED